jgi:hypothetical protein
MANKDTQKWKELVERYKEDYPEISHLDEENRQYIFLAYFSLTRCNITKSCLMAQVSKPRTYYGKWLKNERFKEIIDVEKESMVDVLENDLFNLAKTKTSAVIFALCNLAPDKWRNKYYTDNVNKNITVDELMDQFLNPDEVKEQNKEDESKAKTD